MTQGIPFDDIQDHQCHHVIDPTRYAQRYCGETSKDGSNYCEQHHADTHVTPKRKLEAYNFNRPRRAVSRPDPYNIFAA